MFTLFSCSYLFLQCHAFNFRISYRSSVSACDSQFPDMHWKLLIDTEIVGGPRQKWVCGLSVLISHVSPALQQMAGWCPVNSNKTQQSAHMQDKNTSGASRGRKWASWTVCAPDAPCCTLTQLCTDTLTDTMQVSPLFFFLPRQAASLINLLSQIFPSIKVQSLQDSVSGNESFSLSSCQDIHCALKLSTVNAWSQQKVSQTNFFGDYFWVPIFYFFYTFEPYVIECSSGSIFCLKPSEPESKLTKPDLNMKGILCVVSEPDLMQLKLRLVILEKLARAGSTLINTYITQPAILPLAVPTLPKHVNVHWLLENYYLVTPLYLLMAIRTWNGFQQKKNILKQMINPIINVSCTEFVLPCPLTQMATACVPLLQPARLTQTWISLQNFFPNLAQPVSSWWVPLVLSRVSTL